MQIKISTLLIAFVALAGVMILFNVLHIGGNDFSLRTKTVAVERVLLEDNVPVNSKFRVTESTRDYQVNPNPKCYMDNCKDRNNRLAYEVCSESAEATASEWNALGVRAMERVVDGELKEPSDMFASSLIDAYWYFSNATAVDSHCATALTNLGIVEIKKGMYDEGIAHLQEAVQLHTTAKAKAISNIFIGLAYELKGDRQKGVSFYNQMKQLAPDMERQWWGIPVNAADRQELHHYGTNEMLGPLLDMALYKYFGRVAIWNHALLNPKTQDFFIKNHWIATRKILPPFVLAAVQRCYRDLIDHKKLPFGDTQSKRFTAYNDRCARFIHYQLTDFITSVIAHNAKPSYTYFGGYRSPGELAPHNDREQCEWTLSLTVDQGPRDVIWSLAAKDPFGKEVSADLEQGDGFLFMGRILAHWRKGKLPEGHWLNQVFLHYVNQDFSKSLN